MVIKGNFEGSEKVWNPIGDDSPKSGCPPTSDLHVMTPRVIRREAFLSLTLSAGQATHVFGREPVNVLGCYRH